MFNKVSFQFFKQPARWAVAVSLAVWPLAPAVHRLHIAR
jgi:hypothetical protein